MIWWFILFFALMLGVREFFFHYRIERVEEEVECELDSDDVVALHIVVADTLEELIAELQKLPPDADITKLYIVLKETEE